MRRSKTKKSKRSRLRKLRKARGFTQETFAEALGVSYQAVQRYEEGVGKTSFARMKRMAEIFDMSIDELAAIVTDESPGQDKVLFHTSEKERILVSAAHRAAYGEAAPGGRSP